MIRVLIADDHRIVLDGIRALLSEHGDIVIVGEASNGADALEMAENLKPDVMVVDLMMPRMNGLQVAKRIQEKHLNTQVVVLTMYSDRGLVRQALASGVRGYILKQSASEDLLAAVRAAASRETYLNHSIETIAQEIQTQPDAAAEEYDILSSLSPREREVLQLIAEEHSGAEIAELLFITIKTVEKHRANLMGKLQVHNTAGLVRMAIKIGLIKED